MHKWRKQSNCVNNIAFYFHGEVSVVFELLNGRLNIQVGNIVVSNAE